MKLKLILIPIVLLIGMGLGWYLKPDTIKTETKTVEVTKEIRKDFEDVKENIRVIEHPNGTKETITDRTAKRLIESDLSKEKERIKKREEAPQPPQWSVGAYMSILDDRREYTVTVDRRVLGNLFVGIYAQGSSLEDTGAGIGLRFEF
jgi:hypothetical protein